MRRIIYSLAVSVLVAGALPALAQDRTSGTTTTEAEDVTRGYLQSEILSIKPMVGVVGFDDQTLAADKTSRAAYGLSLDYNMSSMVTEASNFYVGPSFAFIYSHLGAPGSNLFGSAGDNVSGAVGGGSGANMIVIPTNLKVGYNLSDNFRISAHGGGNVIYRSIASSINLDSDSAGSDSLWKYYPNVGADLDIGLGRNVALTLRPDWTFAPNNDVLMATLGLGIALG